MSEDVDPWYKDMKKLIDYDKYDLKIAPDVISFHYVSQMESSLLYHLLSNKYIYNGVKINSSQLYTLWPKFENERGPYSRRLYNEIEASNLLQLICNDIVISSPLCE